LIIRKNGDKFNAEIHNCKVTIKELTQRFTEKTQRSTEKKAAYQALV
jgi:hypothetical protein